MRRECSGGLAQYLEGFGSVSGEAVELADGLFRVSLIGPPDKKLDANAGNIEVLRASLRFTAMKYGVIFASWTN